MPHSETSVRKCPRGTVGHKIMYMYIWFLQVGNSDVQCKVIGLLPVEQCLILGNVPLTCVVYIAWRNQDQYRRAQGGLAQHPCGITRPTAPKRDTHLFLLVG